MSHGIGGHQVNQPCLKLLGKCFVASGVQRSGDARGDCLIVCPLPIFSFEQWCTVVIVTEHKLFVTSQYDVIFTFANQRFGEVC